MTLGLILSSILMAGRPRLLLLVMSGEIWPVSPQDVQFAMPASLVPNSVAQQCWSTELLQSWKEGQEVELDAAMLEARRKAVRILRKVSKETEKMTGRLLGQATSTEHAGGIGGVWEKWIAEGRSNISAAECAEYLLNTAINEPESTPVTVKKNTLPAYAAHNLMMERSDLFLADGGEMWKSGDFTIRSQTDRDRILRVQAWFDQTTDQGRETVKQFAIKSKAAIAYHQSLKSSSDNVQEHQHNLPDWTSDELDIIALLFSRTYEIRATQTSPAVALSYLIMKGINCYPGEEVDQPLIKRFLRDIGMLSPHETLERARTIEADQRNMALKGINGKKLRSEDLLSGIELDDVREDFTGHTVYVVDDASASELDDGISIEKASGDDHWVHIHVADPTRYLRPEHPVSTRASFMGSSIYAPEGNLPLLPLDVTMKELSLGADVDRQGVMTFSALVGPDGSIKDEKVRMGWIRSPRVITYSAVNEALQLTKGRSTRPFGTPVSLGESPKDTSKPSESDLVNLRLLHEFAVQHKKRRYADSGLEWFLPTASIRLVSPLAKTPVAIYDLENLPSKSRFITGEPDIEYTVSHDRTTSVLSAQLMIAECMILAGTVAASFCHKHSIPVPFRGSIAPRVISAPGSSEDSTSIDHLMAQRDEYGSIDPFVIMGSNLLLPPGELSTSIIPHWNMGLTQPGTGYLRATSPLRRFDDLLAHWQIKSHLAQTKGIKAPWSRMNDDEVLELARRSDIGMKRNKRGSSNAEGWWLTRLVQHRLEGVATSRYKQSRDTVDLYQPLEARITGPVTSNREGRFTYPAWVPSLSASIDVDVPKGTDLIQGQTINARIVSANSDPMPRISSLLVS